MFNLCLMAPNFDKADLSTWRVCGYGGAIMPEATLKRIAEKLPKLKLLNCYRSTETTSPAAIMPPGTGGRPKGLRRSRHAVPCGHILVIDADGVEAPYREPGGILIGGAMIVPGYFNNPEATEREFKGGYWKSGDLGRKRLPQGRRPDQGRDQPGRLQDLRFRGRERPP
jgi:O-succinylbenzoic acid--CoA ligase